MQMKQAVNAAVLATLLVCAVAACAATDPSSAARQPGGTAARPKVTVAGDSISIGLGASLRTVLGNDVDTKVIGEEGTGLARPDRFDWPTRLAKLATEFPPKVLVFSVASNDALDLTDNRGKVVVPSSDKAAWDEEYSRRLGAAFDAFAATDTKIVWVGHVRTADDKVGLTNRHIQALATAVAASRGNVTVADLAELLGTGAAKATRCLVADGVHLTVACLDEAAARLRAALPLA